MQTTHMLLYEHEKPKSECKPGPELTPSATDGDIPTPIRLELFGDVWMYEIKYCGDGCNPVRAGENADDHEVCLDDAQVCVLKF